MIGNGGLQRIAIDAVLVYHVMGASIKIISRNFM